MLCDIYTDSKIQGHIDQNLVQFVLVSGNYWELVWRYPEIFKGHEDNSDLAKEIVNILDMWIPMETSYENLSDDDKRRVISQIPSQRRNLQLSVSTSTVTPSIWISLVA